MEECARAKMNVIAFRLNRFFGRLMQMLREVLLATWVLIAPCQCVFRVTTILIATRQYLRWEEKVAFGVPTEVFVWHLMFASAQKAGQGIIVRHRFAKQKLLLS
jgi:hypothetical protein